ncbi:hypothetical protein TIFTF001_016716 [Ficus carica]|uniref:Uncharacterized protein n=1 Tax=Ficus carica TaxID=3494 RepID=A0AA88ATK9_FICCA|nr:hypothetical protein TIFTF001_016716 [Ficus carica]
MKTMADLMNVKMKSNECLKTFLKRFTHELNKVEVIEKRVVEKIFRDGLLRKHELHEMLTRELPKCMADVIMKAEGSIRAEEVGYVKAPKPITLDPDSRDKTRIYELQDDHGHTSEECRSLRGQIQAMIRQGELS